MSATRWGAGLTILLLVAGCKGVPGQTAPPPPLASPATASGVVFCADGAGGLGGTTYVLRHIAAEKRLPLRVELVDWSHGVGRVLADHMHWRHIKEHGGRLARQVQVHQTRHPDIPVFLVGQSSGSAVVLVAAEHLPPDSLERIVLLAASVSTDYDLRRALLATRQGIDSFHSTRDVFVLGVGAGICGTSDRRWAPAAGRVGFRAQAVSPQDRALYAKLHQHAWNPDVGWTGHKGGHFGADSPGFVRAYVMPLLAPRAYNSPHERTARPPG